MKILYLNGADIEGGAAKAATRLLRGIHERGIDARLYVQRKSGNDPLIDGPGSLPGKAFALARPSLEQLVCGIKPGKINGPFCASLLPDGLAARASRNAPDIIHMHWVARMMRLETLARFSVPMVWTLHDSWAFTGGCYLPLDCTRYRENCGSCPVLGSAREDDLSRRVWLRKQKAWQGLNLTLVAPSRWMAERARSSSLFCGSRIETIPNGIDLRSYSPSDKRAARELFSLPQDKKLVLFGGKGTVSDTNKGIHLLAQALRELASGPLAEKVELVAFGTSRPETPIDLGFKCHYLGWFGDDSRLARLYSAADVFVFPSIQETLGYTAMEAMACGTPCVAFDQGGVPDLIDHCENGYLARPYQPIDLSRGISWVIEDEERHGKLSAQARRKIEREFSLDKVAERHLKLYRELLGHD